MESESSTAVNGRLVLLYSAATVLMARPAPAQIWEAGGAVGFGFYRDAALTGAQGSGRAGFGPRFALTAVAGRSLGDHINIEGRYIFQDGDPEIASGSLKANLDGDASAFTGELAVSPLSRRARLRPYLAGGGGIKDYRGTQDPKPVEPLMNLALLHHATQAVGLLTYGGGVKFHLAPHWRLRLDLRDYATPFPNRVISAAPGVRLRGWLHDFVPLLGVSWTR